MFFILTSSKLYASFIDELLKYYYHKPNQKSTILYYIARHDIKEPMEVLHN